MRTLISVELAVFLAALSSFNVSSASAAPKPVLSTIRQISLSTVVPVSVQQGWGALSVNRSLMGRKLKIAGKEFETGLATHANSRIVYDLEGAYDRFEAWVGIDAEMAEYPQASVRFRVLADGRELFNSGVMRANTQAVRVDVAVKGAQELTLIADNASDGIDCDHADWAGAMLTQAVGPTAAQRLVPKYKVSAPGITLRLTADGQLAGINSCAVRGKTRLMGCIAEGKAAAIKLNGGGIEFRRKLRHGPGNGCLLTERFLPQKDSVRWEMEITGNGSPWSTAISTNVNWPASSGTRFWTAWSDPDPTAADQGWHDPLVPQPMANLNLSYGGRSARNMYCVTIPIFTLIEPQKSFGLSFVMSPEDTTLDATLSTSAAGDISFRRTNNRISSQRRVRFAIDIIPHAPDFRPGLDWMAKRYPAYFDLPSPKADEIAGLGAYSSYEGELDSPKLRQMGFRVNWKASYDFPYMGMFIPPVKDNEKWKPLAVRPAMSVRKLADYSELMRESRFYVLNYFNCNEIGNQIQWPAPPRKATTDQDLWKDPNDFVFYQASNAWLRSTTGRPVFSWRKCVVADPADPFYRGFLIEQARLHAQKLPMSSGICIDRLDWMRLYNAAGDDGASWIDGKPSRFLMTSWNSLMTDIGRIMHSAGKVIFVNPVYKRLDAMRNIDGIYDEMGYWGTCLNASSFLTLKRPLIAWTASEGDLQPDPDAYFQRHLYMGAFPTAPVPGNDHTINPSPSADKWYLDYGPLFDLLRGRKWVLRPRPIEVIGGIAKANIFKVPGGYVVSVVFGGKKDRANISLCDLPGLSKSGKLICRARYPGRREWIAVQARASKGRLIMSVPLERGCAMIEIKIQKVKG